MVGRQSTYSFLGMMVVLVPLPGLASREQVRRELGSGCRGGLQSGRKAEHKSSLGMMVVLVPLPGLA